MSLFTGTEFIRDRRSLRRYRSDRIPEEIIRDILICGSLAPTARNVQPWLLGAVTDEGLLESLAELAEYGKFIRESPVCFAVFTLADEKYFLEDGCAATMNMIAASSIHGLGTCWIAGHKKAYAGAVRSLLGVPDRYTLISLISAGFPDEEPSITKKPFRDVAFFERYGGGPRT